MNTDLTHDELLELVACHAVGALDPAETELVERHLAACATCSAELSAHLDTLAQLTATEAPSPSVWSAIESEILDEADRQDNVVPLRSRRPVTTWVPTAVAAAVALVLGLTVGLGLGGDDTTDVDAVAAAFASSDAAVAQLVADDVVAGRVAVLPDGHAAIETSIVPAAGRVLQVWAVVPTDGDPLVISVGLLDGQGRGVFVLDGDPSTIVITDEPAGGSVVARGPAVAAGEITSA